MTDEKTTQSGMGPLARLAAIETWARAEYGEDMPEPLRLALYGDVQPADLVRESGPNADPCECCREQQHMGAIYKDNERILAALKARQGRVMPPGGESDD